MPEQPSKQPVDLADPKQHDKLVKEIEEKYDYFFKQLTPLKNSMSRYHRLYLAERKDHRKQHEMWRSFSWLGDPFQLTETETSARMDILNAIDPPIQTEGVGTEDEWKARSFERSLDYFLRANRWSDFKQEMILRTASIQGWTWIKTGWKKQAYTVTARPDRAQMVGFDTAVNNAIKGGLPSPPDAYQKPQEFAGWMDSARKLNPQMPAAPGLVSKETVTYRGPWIYRISDFDLFFDPYVEDPSEHKLIIQRVVLPWSEIEKNPSYDKTQVAKAKEYGGENSGSQTRLSKWDQEIAAAFGLSFNPDDPMYRSSGELWEVWRPFDTQPYLVICNRKFILNIRATENPFWHKQHPFTLIRNFPLGGRAVGMSSYFQIEKLIADRLTFHDLLMDATLLSVLPVYVKARSMGMSENDQWISPGKILQSNDPANALRSAAHPVPGFSEIAQVLQMLLTSENQTLSTGENVRGQQATVGRVSATEAQSRLQQGLSRHKNAAIRLEGDFNPIIPQFLMNVYQFWPGDDPQLSQLRAKMVGQDEQDPWADQEFTRDTFIESLNMDIKFRGATRLMNRELTAQQLKDFLATCSGIQVAPGVSVLSPKETRAAIERLYRTLGHKGALDIISAEGTQTIQQAAEQAWAAGQQVAAAQAQSNLQAITNPQPAPAPEKKTPEETIQYKDTPPDIQRQLEQRAGLQPSMMGDQFMPNQLPKPAPKPVDKGGFPPDAAQ